jgi:hypothetical protein
VFLPDVDSYQSLLNIWIRYDVKRFVIEMEKCSLYQIRWLWVKVMKGDISLWRTGFNEQYTTSQTLFLLQE